MTFLSRKNRLDFNISPEFMKQGDIPILEYTDPLDIPALHHRDRECLYPHKPFDKGGCEDVIP